MTPEFKDLATNLHRIFRDRRYRSLSRELLAREALLNPQRFISQALQVDEANAERFLCDLDDAIADPEHVVMLPKYWGWRGITAEVAACMIEDRRAGRPVCLPKQFQKPAGILRTAAYLEKVRVLIADEIEDKRIADIIAAEEAEREAKRLAQAERDAFCEPFREADEDILARFGDMP